MKDNYVKKNDEGKIISMGRKVIQQCKSEKALCEFLQEKMITCYLNEEFLERTFQEEEMHT